ncbi:MAG: hypothetical protein EOO06_00370 [Chitinophagaceae bacterium]|nr:MAG: hypothetical protein EOO06_00370 [Chitinophagaceae bacterium]
MNRNEMIQKLKDQFKSFLSFSETTVETIEVTTEDGVKMMVNSAEITVGVEIFLVNEDGIQSPVENGDYKLEDGRTITVEDGKISAIAEKEESTEETSVEDAPVEFAEETSVEETSSENDLETRVAALESQVSEILSKMETMSLNNNQMFSKIEEFSKTAGAESIQINKTGAKAYSSNLSIDGELEIIRNLSNKFKK